MKTFVTKRQCYLMLFEKCCLILVIFQSLNSGEFMYLRKGEEVIQSHGAIILCDTFSTPFVQFFVF